MTRLHPRQSKSAADLDPALDPPPIAPWITRGAFILTLVLIIARAMMTETVRDAFKVMPHTPAAPAGPGATTTLYMNLLCCLPALMVLARRAIDATWTLRATWSHLLLALLGIWACISVAWSHDRFLAAITASTTLTAAVLVWSTAQLVRSWTHLRVVGGVAIGLLLIYVAQGLVYRFSEYPQNVAFWQEHKAEILQQHGWQPGSFDATQFEKKLLSGEMIGFNQSPNSFAAVIVMLMVISAGVALQRRADGDAISWSVAIAVVFIPACVVLYYTGSRTAAGTLLIAACLLLALAPARARALLARRPGVIYLGGAIVCVGGALMLIGHGIAHGSLPQDSLNFRWRYWVASFRMWEHHRWLGVGWGNFGESYLAFRLPAASEEIRDPHNFIVRCFAELGLIGGVLVLAWLARAAWELTRPVVPPSISSPSARSSTMQVVSASQGGSMALAVFTIAVGGAALNAAIAIDFSQPQAYLVLELFRRVLAIGLLVLGLMAAIARGRADRRLDDRPAPWVLWGLIIALGVFFIHNLIDFVIAEPGPLILFAAFLGAALGLREPSDRAPRLRRIAAAGLLSAACLAWLWAALAVALPVALAEGQADRGDDAMRADEPDLAAGLYHSALQSVPYNADYAYRTAEALMRAGAPADQILAMLDRAIAIDPMNVSYYATRAEFEMQLPHPDASAVASDYDRGLALDPQNVQLRLDFAATLARLGQKRDAAGQYREALRRNDLLSPDEPKRLSAQAVKSIEQRIKALSAS